MLSPIDDEMRVSFLSRFGAAADAFLVRAPGRVNLIGEHTDYNGYPAMPMAIDRSIRFLAAPAEEEIVDLVPLDERFPRRTFPLAEADRPFPTGDWGNYARGAALGLIESGLLRPGRCLGVNAVVAGDIPIAAGLSSSSATVVAAGLALLHANALSPDRPLLADLLARAERHAGTEGGGMDQAISLLAREGEALKIDFFPLRTRSLPIPDEFRFVICNSLVRAAKSEEARRHYNLRAVECRLALLMIRSAIAARTGSLPTADRLADLTPERTGLSAAELGGIAQSALPPEGCTLEEIAAAAGTSIGEIDRTCLTLRDGTRFDAEGIRFRLLKRYRHVVTEAERVERAADALGRRDISAFGALMNASHLSCREDYEISCPEIEALVNLARRRGAIGARLTGAGFGGCTVNLVPASRLDDFIRAMQSEWPPANLRAQSSDREMRIPPEEIIFPVSPSAGATIFTSPI